MEFDGHLSLGGLVSSVGDAVSTVTDGVSEAATAVGEFVVEHKAVIAGIATGIVVYAGCTGATVGGGVVACAAVAGAAGSAVENALDDDADQSVGGYAKSMAGGAAMGLVTLGAGKALSPVVSKLAAPLKTVAGKATGKVASAARSAVSRFKGGCSSFAGATVVLMADGSEKAIEDIQVGDKVLATDPETGEQVAKDVTHVWVHDDTLVDLIVDGEAITTTEDHPFFNVTDGDFQWASEIDPGDQVLTDNGRVVTVRGIDTTSAQDALAYNLTIDGIHTYHVGQRHFLVHNSEICNVKTGGESKAAATGRQIHKLFDEGLEQLSQLDDRWQPGLKSGPHRPDGFFDGKPIELKPHTPSGISAGRSQLNRYMTAFKQEEGHLYTYDTSGNISLYQSVVRRLGGRDLL